MKKNIFKSDGFQSLLASLLCIVLGLFLGYLVLLVINPAGAGEAILTVIKNFMTYNRPASQLKYFGNTLVKTAPLLMCALAILFAYKVGLFNIGAAGQYCAGVALSLYAALGLGWSWLPCMLLAICGGAILGGISGLLKSYCNVNEVISGIMLNWIVLYLTNMLLTTVKEDASPYTKVLAHINESAVLPSLGLGALFNNNQYVGLAVPLAVLMAILVWVVLEKTKFGYELKATGYNKNAAKYCGMAEKRNVILSLMISGALAVVNSFTAPVSKANAEARETAARQELIPEASSFEQVTEGLPENVLSAYVGKASDGSVAGYVITASGKGFGGTIQVMVAISPEGTILRCKTLDVSSETKTLGGQTANESYYGQYEGQDSSLSGVSAISGATITSTAYESCVKAAFAAYETLKEAAK